MPVCSIATSLSEKRPRRQFHLKQQGTKLVPKFGKEAQPKEQASRPTCSLTLHVLPCCSARAPNFFMGVSDERSARAITRAERISGFTTPTSRIRGQSRMP